jgi:alkylation response protein AidB-like acyl-CoA dehydrogenase
MQARVSAFVGQEIRPIALSMAVGEGPSPDALVRTAGEWGLAGLLVSQRHGGAGASYRTFTRFIEAVARECASSSVILDVHLSVGTEPIVTFGTDEQRARFLPAIASGACTSAFALTEPGSGSDAAGLQTRAVRDGDSYRLTGTKAFITNGGAAGVYVVIARTGDTPREITAFIVDANSRGLRSGRPMDKMGLRGSWTAELVLDDVEVSVSERLGQEGAGFHVAMTALDRGRLGIGAQAVGIAEGCIRAVVDHARAAGVAGDEGALADMCCRAEAGRLLVAHAAELADAGLYVTHEASVAKLYATDAAVASAHAAVELCAPDSVREDHAAAIRFRDAKAGQIYEGTNQVQRIVIARALLAPERPPQREAGSR